MSTVPQQCVANPACGWCGDKNSCIQGTNRGPLSPCLRNTFLFNSPGSAWNPLKASQININTEGRLNIVGHPNLALVKANKYN
jgi:hypothetical protein